MTIDLVLINSLLGFLIGLTLGLLGGGGSILTVPALVYLVGQTPQAAVTTSLAIVGVNSAVGTFFHQRSGRTANGGALNWKVATLFGGAGMVTAYLAASLSRHFPPALLMVLFSLLMLVVGAVMLLQKQSVASHTDLPDQRSAWVTLAAGAGVGLLTGILGVGGGFLIVPALVMLVGLPIVQAVGTSLAIIAVNSFAGLMGHLGSAIDVSVTIIFAAAGIVGTFIGAKLTHKLPARLLRQLFAVFVIVLGFFLLLDNLPKLLA